MGFLEAIASEPVILAEGSVAERLRRDRSLTFDPHLGGTALVLEEAGARIMAGIYREYLDAAVDHGLPMIVLAPTWRADPERVRAAAGRSCEEVNREVVRFLLGIRSEYGDHASRIFVGGLLKCRGDAYDPRDALSEADAARFHEEQARALAGSGLDFLLAATLPAFSEAKGMARAMGARGLPYFLSFVLRREGTLLDGTSLHEAVDAIDAEVAPPPLGYWANCTHPRVFTEALARQIELSPGLAARIHGLQANTSDLPPEELEEHPALLGEDPDVFASLMLRAHEDHGTRILGGCCGTDGTHIRRLAERIREK